MSEDGEVSHGDDGRAWLKETAERANRGDTDAVDALRRFLDDNPGLARRMGGLAGHAESALVELIAAGDALTAESVRREADRLRGELLGKANNPLERLLADQMVAAQLYLRHLQLVAAESPGATRGQSAALARRLERARRAHASAVKELAAMRKLLPSGKSGRG